MIRTRIKPYHNSMICIDLFTEALEVRTDQVLLCSKVLYYIPTDLSRGKTKFFSSLQNSKAAPLYGAVW